MSDLEKIQETQIISLPDEIWDYVKEFIFDWKETHRRKFSIVLWKFPESCWKMKPKYYRWTTFPSSCNTNTNDIIRDEYYDVLSRSFISLPKLVLISICYNPHGGGGWWCGYGWEKVYCL